MFEEIDGALEHGAEGIGLFRTEFMYMNRTELPTEDEHYHYARTVLEKLAGRPTTFRTLRHAGGDKGWRCPARCLSLIKEVNPALGLRSIRICLAPEGRPLFQSQLRGLLRASVHGPLRIMFPMVSGVAEVREVKAIVEEAKEELRRRGEPFDPALKIGVMIEMPSAALTADLIASEVDFFSIGTNDLIQYTLAIDRVNEHVSYLYRPLHPAILSMLKFFADASRAKKIPVAMCGEMAGEPLLALIVVGLGLTELSMNAVSIPVIKSVLRASTAAEARALAEEALTLATPEDIEDLVQGTHGPTIRRRAPENLIPTARRGLATAGARRGLATPSRAPPRRCHRR